MLHPQDCRFWKVALQAGLVDEARLRACWAMIPDEKRTADAIDRRLARRLVECGLMTRWQAQQLLSGIKPQALTFDKYVIEDLLGQGGMGRVYLARDRMLRRRVALKLLSRERMKNPRALARFRREAWVGAQLQHENLVRVYDAGEEGGQQFLVMEYIEGKTISQILTDRGPLPAALAARLARQVALGLEHARMKGLVHRDVNPMNILLDRSGTAKLTDMGLAIDLDEQGDAVTRDGATVGTFDYISPEQARHSRSIDIRSDIYSLGCTLFQMLTARVPFPLPSLPEKLYAHQMLDPEPIESLVAGVPRELEAIVRRMMAKRPEDRFATPAELAGWLETYQCGPVALAEIESSPEVAILIDTQPKPSSAGPEIAPEAAPTVVGAEAPHMVGGEPGTSRPGGPRSIPEGSFSGDLPGEPVLFSSIDIGPEPSLADSALMARRSGSSEFPTRPRQVAWLAIPVILAVLLILTRTYWPVVGSPNSAGSPNGFSKGTARSIESLPDLAVHWLDDPDGIPQAVPSLREALRLAVDKNAEVRLHSSEPMRISPEDVLSINGRVTIRAGEGASPVLQVGRGRTRPLLEVGLNGAVALIGLTIELDGEGEGPLPRSLIESVGELRVDHCALRATGEDRSVAAMHVSGRKMTLTNSTLIGFDVPVRVDAVGDSQNVLRNCLLTRDAQPGESLSQRWGLSITRSPAGGVGARTVEIDHCTLIGLGLMCAQGFNDEEPLTVSVESSVVQAQALIMWTATQTPFPVGMGWAGESNLYSISAVDSWIASDPNDPQSASVAENPTSLESWRRIVSSEVGTQTLSAPFSRDESDSVEQSPPTEFVLAGSAGKDRGIRLRELGPPVRGWQTE